MQRSPTLAVIVLCPHHGRAVTAKRNTAIDCLVSCDESETCRAPRSESGSLEAARIFPQGCPVFPSLAKLAGG